MAKVDTLDQLKTGLDYHLARQNLLASNLAHVDTPGYASVDLARSNFDGALHVAMATTNGTHIESAARTDQGFRVVVDPAAGPGADGNGVDLDREPSSWRPTSFATI